MPLWEHQLRCLDEMADRGRNSYLLDAWMGSGKTRIALTRAVDVAAQRVLIFCPSAVIAVWEKEIRAMDFRSDAKVTALGSGSVSKKADKLSMDLQWRSEAWGIHFVIVNYESAWRKPLGDYLGSMSWDLFICDESHRIKNGTTKQSKFAQRISKKSEHKLCLSGTPLPNSHLDVFGQALMLDPSIFGRWFTRFRKEYSYLREAPGFVQVLGPRNVEEYQLRYDTLAVKVSESEMDLPELIISERVFQLEPKAFSIYKAIEDEMFALVGDGFLDPSNALVKLLRMRQITSGVVPVGKYKVNLLSEEDLMTVEVERISVAKQKAFLELLDDIPHDEPIVVFCSFTSDLDQIQEACEKSGMKYAELSGRRKDIQRWYSGEAQVIGVNARAGAEGISLVQSKKVIFWNIPWLYEWQQAIARCRRPGQESETVVAIHLIAANTIEATQIEAHSQRKSFLDLITGSSR